MLNIEGSRRAETLSVVEFARLADALEALIADHGTGPVMDAASGLRLIAARAGSASSASTRMVLEWQEHRLLLDAGVLFPSAEHAGRRLHRPRLRVPRRAAAARCAAILLTHGHEDHIGALAFALAGGAARPSTAAASRSASRGAGCASAASTRRPAPAHARRSRSRSGPFRVHPIRVAHSVLDSLALAIETPAGVVLTSGDFKIDARTAPPTSAPTWTRSRAWGDRGVLALLSDSTNVEQRGRTGRRGRRASPPSRRSSRARAGACSSPASRPPSRASSAWPTSRGARAARSASWAAAWSTTPTWPLELGPAAHPRRRRLPAPGRRASYPRRRPGALRLRQPGRAALRAVA